jgi:hypothetical protein
MIRASMWDTIRALFAAIFYTYPGFCRWLDRNQLDIGPGSKVVRTSIGAVGRHLCIVIGRWKLENWHVYRYTEHRDAKTGGRKARWMMWDRII